jgi:putative transposase
LCALRRRRVFTDAGLVSTSLELISHSADNWRFAVLAYCFMPDHLHLLVEAVAHDADLLSLAHAIKQKTGHAFRRQSARLLWQKGYYERVLRDGDSTAGVARYILMNPVVAGLCQRPGEYPFAGSLVWSNDELADLWVEAGGESTSSCMANGSNEPAWKGVYRPPAPVLKPR